jgi:hypothetical protein
MVVSYGTQKNNQKKIPIHTPFVHLAWCTNGWVLANVFAFQQILLVGFATKILGFFSSVNSTNFVHFWKDSPNFQYHKFENNNNN